MRRADRLFQIVQLIRGRRLTTAAFLARRLEVSERTIYRDVADLQRQSVPIEGEAGIGYRLGAGFELPPLMFTQDEARALAAAARLAQSWLDPGMAGDVESALGKILSVLPPSARAAAEALALFALPVSRDAATRERLQTLREAVQSRHKLRLDYRDVNEAATRRTVRPLGCFYWGKVWTLAAWCELRQDFRSFRVDRIDAAQVLPERFADEPGRTLADLLRRLRERRPPPDPAQDAIE
ncbi:YafY family protein [Ottowia sp.]|jgi:predicted DNA-binding transcriptional regulator YafY|uniref:helix-turn-helix transcriptional regulator n=1 Tax=Ottowia sp. TaxID=1898956 RepID=UPI0025D71076|nr:YafY family protein [Ottowia sp.]MBK6613413.1 YafY family transcriptional regulator [Ottowia sp.]